MARIEIERGLIMNCKKCNNTGVYHTKTINIEQCNECDKFNSLHQFSKEVLRRYFGRHLSLVDALEITITGHTDSIAECDKENYIKATMKQVQKEILRAMRIVDVVIEWDGIRGQMYLSEDDNE
jgi:ribosomal protein S6